MKIKLPAIALTPFLALSVAALSTGLPAAAQSQARRAPVAAAPVEGVVRISGSREMRPLLQAWAADFARTHPRVRIVDRLRGDASGIYGLEQRTAEIALMGRKLHPFERYGTYERSWTYPVGFEVATGAEGDTAPYVVVVHRDNPLASMSVAQLDGVFGASRAGGWDKLDWNARAARGSEADIRDWGQLGVRGALAGRAITPYGEAHLGAGELSDFQQQVMQGGASWNEALREYPTRDALLAALAGDPSGMGVTTAGPLPPGLKAIAVSAAHGGPAVAPARTAFADRSYPLARPAYAFVTIDDAEGDVSETRVPPATEAFIRYMLSPAGQRIVAAQTRYLPLGAANVRRQLDTLASREWPAERPRP